MAAFLSSLLAALIPKLLEYVWAKANTELKKRLAQEALKDYIDNIQADYKKLQIDFETLKLIGKVNEQEIEKLRAAKILLEERLLNSK